MGKRNSLVRRGLFPTVVSRKESANDGRHENINTQEVKDLILVFN